MISGANIYKIDDDKGDTVLYGTTGKHGEFKLVGYPSTVFMIRGEQDKFISVKSVSLYEMNTDKYDINEP